MTEDNTVSYQLSMHRKCGLLMPYIIVNIIILFLLLYRPLESLKLTAPVFCLFR